MWKSIMLMSLVALIYAAEGTYSLELNIFGVSYHGVRSYEWNEINPGLGINAVYHDEDNTDLVLSVGTYIDSYSDRAIYCMIGGRKRFGNLNRYHAALGASVGYLNGSGSDMVGAMLYGSVGYDRLSVVVTGMPSLGNMDSAYVGAFLNLRVLTFD